MRLPEADLVFMFSDMTDSLSCCFMCDSTETAVGGCQQRTLFHKPSLPVLCSFAFAFFGRVCLNYDCGSQRSCNISLKNLMRLVCLFCLFLLHESWRCRTLENWFGVPVVFQLFSKL